MKRNYLCLFIILLFAGFMHGQATEIFESETMSSSTHAHLYSGSAANNVYNNPSFTLTNFSTCQTSVTLAAHGSNWAGYNSVRYAIEVNGNTIANNLYGDYNVDLTPYIPVTSVKIRSDGWSQYWLAMHATVTVNSPVASMPTTVPTVTNATLCSSSLPYTTQATLTEGGTTLKWYSNESGSDLSLDSKVITTSGNHTLWVSQADASGCEGVRVPVTINVTDVNATTAVTKSSCLVANGAIVVTPTSGTGPYTYSWQDGITTKDRTNITWGDYAVTVTDSNNCSKVINVTVGMTTDMVVTETSKTNVTCYGGNDGALSINVTGGAAPYSYQWPTSVVTGAGTASISGLTAGTYNVVITDANNCVTNASFNIGQNSQIQGYYFVDGESYNCFPSDNNTATVEAMGGNGEYTYSWAPYGGTAATATNLANGIYEVTVTDGNGCQGIIVVEIYSNGLSGTVTASQTNVTCNGGSNGTATITIDSEFESFYFYSWYPTGGDGPTATGLSAGVYEVTAFNMDYGCEVKQSFTITEPAPLTASIAVNNEAGLPEITTGVLQVTPTGGTAPYTYLWNTGATTATISNFTSDTYSCTVTDANGCVAALAVIDIVFPTDFEISGGGTVCAQDTEKTITVSGSEVGVTYQLQLEGTNVGTALAGTGSALTFSDLIAAGTYTVVATNTFTNASITMTDSVSITAFNYEIEIATPTILCTDNYAVLEANLINENAIIISGFAEDFAPENWTFLNNNTNGNIDTSNVPESIIINGGNDQSESSGNTDYSIVIPATGTLSFNWSYNTNDGAQYDYPQIVYNGNAVIFNNFDLDGSNTQSGNITLGVEVGDTLTLRMYTADNGFGAATVTITDFKFDVFMGESPTMSWTASNGGELGESIDDFSVYALTSGTYTLTATSGNCTVSSSVEIDFNAPTITGSTTWNGETWSNGEPQIGMKAIIDGNLVISSELTVCEIEVTPNGSITVVTDALLGVIGKIKNNATAADFVVENKGTLIQSKNIQNEGAITVNVNSFPLYRQDYTLWGSPVIAQNLRSFSPQTLFNRFSSYDETLGTVGDYVQEIVTNQDMLTKNFVAAKGYLIRMPNNWTEYINETTPGIAYPGVFKGVPQNGTFSIPLTNITSGLNLVSNPYPSAIMMSEFFDGNPGIEQTIYFWRKRNGAAGSGYATYNAMGFVTSQQELSVLGPILDASPEISTGQGFFIKSNGLPQLNFTNEMRSSTNSGIFLKSASQEKHRFRLNLSNSSTIVGQTLIGYTQGATSGIDNGMDSSYFNDSSTALTSLINGQEYIIQGLGLPFEATNAVPMGFKTNTPGMFTIALDTFDGLFEGNQNIYIKDNLTGNVTNLKETAYNFSTESGVFNNRFEVVYQTTTLGVTQPDIDADKVVVYKQNDGIYIDTISLTMQKVELYDIGGRLMQELNDINQSTVNFSNPNLSNQVLLVKITTTDKKVITKKIVY
ncbi:T9SS sorting signal type C domain-containing protein [Flavobacterium sp.]|uniref:T9SS sorting signal type C domain-containing protein n=1 Tax=Flavobacterium sp. TaxID=239 RepID=UPI002621D7B3|nr:T9SS sorting signal type C domain-containing protein [Flavobacterium sp.]MDD3004768.1 T9SS sorting signal type C domain-containing protein [Flavobacterium sp.]